ncbi:hypothetical protein PoB_002745500 [Plakobranchus ocellatus]|uniref:Uncharacterized protein n=1 Tax=Plakobranchus ocellatus TaxID=259542 RepID=A0AAV4A0L4_9GAST|nr:hypothetical protein PoB_002745500 [Plakobranchus ocellatus]
MHFILRNDKSWNLGFHEWHILNTLSPVGSEYVILQSGDEATADQESVVIAPEVNLDGSMIELNTTFEQNQISAVEANMPGTETLHVVDPSTGEAVIIVAEKAIVDLVREQHSTLQATEGGCSLDKIKEIVIGARDSIATSGSSPTQEKTDVNFEGDDKSNVQEEKVLHEEQIDPTKE